MTWQPNEMVSWEKEMQKDAEKEAAARQAQGVAADEAAGEEESEEELDAAWAKERARVEEERQSES